MLGSKEPLSFDVLVKNHGEDAFEAGFYMTVPENLNYKKVSQIGVFRDVTITCTAPSIQTNNTLKCDIGNPLPAGKLINFRVIFDPANKTGLAPAYEFYMEANSTNVESHKSAYDDNIVQRRVLIWVDTKLSVSGNSLPTQMHYNMSEYKNFENATKETELGPHVVHIYDVKNNGTSRIDEVEVFVMWPHETIDGQPLMVLLDQPETSGNIRCEPYYMAEMEFDLDEILHRKSYLHSGGVASRNVYGSSSYGSKWTSGSSRGSGGSRKFHHSWSSSSGHGSSSGHASSSGGRRVYTQDEQNKLDLEENMESTGDASFVHKDRAGQAAQLGGQQGRTYYYEKHYKTQEGQGNQGGQGQQEIYTAGGSLEQKIESMEAKLTKKFTLAQVRVLDKELHLAEDSNKVNMLLAEIKDKAQKQYIKVQESLDKI